MPILPLEWRTPPHATETVIRRLYDRGFAGALHSDEARERFLDGCTIKSGEDVCRLFGFEESAKGALIIPFVHTLEAYPGCLPGGGQLEGDCVSWGQRNANLQAMVGDVVAGLEDQTTGKVEDYPEVSDVARKHGVLSTEAIYAFRSTKPGHGWFCHEAARISQTRAGLVLRKDYGDIDLSTYSKSTVNAFNRKDVPASLRDLWDDHPVREATEVNRPEALRDLLARGFGVNTCGSEGFSSNRNEHGVCERKGTWYHSMAYIAFDDRPWAHRTYGGPLVGVQNSWNEYMNGPRKIYDSEYELPPGAFWARWQDVRKRSMIVMAGATGWPRKLIPAVKFRPGWD